MVLVFRKSTFFQLQRLFYSLVRRLSMCYMLDLKITFQGDPEKGLGKLKIPEIEGFEFRGKYPDYYFSNGGCACGIVNGGGAGVSGLNEVLIDLLVQDVVKRIRVFWYWAGNPKFKTKTRPSEKKLSLREFSTNNDEGMLKENVWYNINDPGKYQYVQKTNA